MVLSAEQIQVIKATVPMIQEHGATVTAAFYKSMLNAHPELNTVFNTSNQVNGHQPRALAGTLFAYAANIDNLNACGPVVGLISNKHVSLCIQPKQYEIVGKYLLEGMREVLHSEFTPAVRDAWAAAYWSLAHILINREAELYKQSEGWTNFRDFRIAKKTPETLEITSFYLEPIDGRPLPAFRPGQSVSVQVVVPELGYPQARQYSLSDMPRPDYYRISVRKDDEHNVAQPTVVAHLSNILHDTINEGDIIKVSHPYGDFYLDDQEGAHPIVLLGGGVGLTPLLSILNTLTSNLTTASNQKISFIHGARTTAARPFRSHIDSLTQKLPNLRATFFTSRPVTEGNGEAGYTLGSDNDHPGRIDLSKLNSDTDLFLNDSSTTYYICGPEEFMVSIRRALVLKGVSDSHVKINCLVPVALTLDI